MSTPLPRRRKKLNLECGFCRKRYTKREHLQDVLNRHTRIHYDLSLKDASEDPQDNQNTTPTLEQHQSEHNIGTDQPHTGISLEDCSSLLWPDSEELLHSILSVGPGAWEQRAPSMPQTFEEPYNPVESKSDGPDISPSDRSALVEDGERAIHSLSGLLGEAFCKVTTPTVLSGLTSRFLDSSLHMFFKNVIPMFPIIHQPTFVFRDCPSPLLLNAIALGALFLGTLDAVIKADALWQLAHTAVATSWHGMLAQRRSYDSCNGVHLAQTVLLSQIYAALSKSKTLRMTSQVFHGMAIFWASHCGMYEMLGHAPLPPTDSPPEMISHAWHTWIARETRIRTLLGLYIVDGVVSQFSGNPTFVRHMANPLTFPSDELTFDANTADEWLGLMHKNIPSHKSNIRFCDVFRVLFAEYDCEEYYPSTYQYGNSLFNYKVVLEGIRSLVSDANRIDPPPIGVPRKVDISRVVSRLRSRIIQDQKLSATGRIATLLQWHTICLDLVVNTARGTRRLCYIHSIPQRIFGGDSRDEQFVDPLRWTQSRAARIALLHASQLHELAVCLPFGMAYDVNVPGAVFAAAATYSAFALAGAGKIVLPSVVDWTAVVNSAGVEEDLNIGAYSGSTQDTLAFIDGSFRDRGSRKDLSYELISIQTLLRGLSLQWGVALEMEEVVGAWVQL
ncbi:ATPase inhibitor, partial [Penicillium atrosanguineum]|uniref:ATPase inhibitor n=1 Tax=Penicillium atrosanguineum TaxID=1132637 RepID=UPI00238D71DD